MAASADRLARRWVTAASRPRNRRLVAAYRRTAPIDEGYRRRLASVGRVDETGSCGVSWQAAGKWPLRVNLLGASDRAVSAVRGAFSEW